MTLNIRFWLNGQEYYSDHIINLSNLIDYFDCTDKLLVLEYNNLICTKKDWERTVISNLDQIEIVTIVGGG